MSEAPETKPKQVYLQLDKETWLSCDCITWCEDQINDTDPCYIPKECAEKAEAETQDARELAGIYSKRANDAEAQLQEIARAWAKWLDHKIMWQEIEKLLAAIKLKEPDNE